MTKAIAFAFPFIFVWAYYDTQEDIKSISQAQVILNYNQELLEAKYEVVVEPKSQENVLNEASIKNITLSSPRFIEVVKAEKPLNLSRFNVIKTNRKINHDKLDLFCMAKNIFHEAGIEDNIGKYAVAQVTLNRLHSTSYPTKICDVVMQPFQFSWANNRHIRWTQPRGPLWEESKEIAHNVLVKGYRLDGLEDALFYHADYVSPNWKKPEAKITKIGTHIFYASAK